MAAVLRRYSRAIVALPLISALISGAAVAQTSTYPNRTITLVLPFAAGSGTDTTTRIISQHLSAPLVVGIVIDTKPGANAMITATYAAPPTPYAYTPIIPTPTTNSAPPY